MLSYSIHETLYLYVSYTFDTFYKNMSKRNIVSYIMSNKKCKLYNFRKRYKYQKNFIKLKATSCVFFLACCIK